MTKTDIAGNRKNRCGKKLSFQITSAILRTSNIVPKMSVEVSNSSWLIAFVRENMGDSPKWVPILVQSWLSHDPKEGAQRDTCTVASFDDRRKTKTNTSNSTNNLKVLSSSFSLVLVLFMLLNKL